MSGPTTPSMRLTTEQSAPMSVRNASVALAAGAGCGKTTVLTERFVALLEGPDARPLNEIVVLTFTEKAARELRDRVRAACRKKIDEGDDPARWRGVLRGLEVARIGTFHQFCGAILRRYPVEAGVDPAFEILDEAIAPTVRDAVLDACLRRWLASRDPDLAALAVDHGLNAVREALADLLARRPDIDFADWARREPAEIVTIWERFRDGRAADTLLRGFADEQADLLDLLARETCSHPVMSARCAFLLARIPRVHESPRPHAELSEVRENAKVQGGGKKAHWSSEEVFESVKARLTRLRARIDPLLEIFAADDGRSLASAEAGARFARLAMEAAATFTRAKAEAGLLDFDDLQSRVRDLLRTGPDAVREDLARSIGVLLVDEFQDTDSVQAEILERLAGADSASGRLFLVGDAKQSIYRFRGAEPAIFGAFRDRFPSEGRLHLTENFRSVPAILAFVNALFAGAFPGEEHALKAGVSGPVVGSSPEVRVEFHWSADAGTKADVGTRRKAEAASLARILAARLSAGWPVRDRDTKQVRVAGPGDVAILFRSRSDFPTYERALEAESLDYHVVGGSTYFAQQEVIDLVNLLSTIEDPLDPLALAGTLRGPIFGVSDEGLFWLASAGAGDLPAAFRDWDRASVSLSDDDRRAVGRASVLLSRWRAEKDHAAIATLLDRALEESGFEAALIGEYLGARKRANVRKLVRLARRYDEKGSFTLADFVARLRADLKTPPREEQAATTDEQGRAVRLMTIHQAKGLEFPIVVLADLDRKPPNVSDLVAYHPELGALIRASGTDDEDERPTWSLGRSLRDRIEARAEREESLRVFYVATTRARDSLILSAGIAPDEPPSSPALQLLADRFDLASGRCLADLPEGWPRSPVGVIGAEAHAPSSLGIGGRSRPKILLAARQISRAGPPFEDDEPGPPVRTPSAMRLDPAHESATMDEASRLFRLVLADPAACGDEPVGKLIARVVSARGTWCVARVRGLVAEHLSAWRASAICRDVGRSDAVRRAIPWTLAWPPGDANGTVFSGRIDFAYRDADGALSLVCVGLDEGRDQEELNLRLSVRAAEGLKLGPIASAWLVALGPRGSARRVEGFEDSDIQRAIHALL